MTMPEQLDTNADASASAITENTQEMLAASIADDITKVFDSAFRQLVAIRDSTYANETEALEQELEALAKEYRQLEEGIRAIEAVLPSKCRLTQHEADELLLNGAKQDAANKFGELEEFKHKPVAMAQRQKEIHAKLQDIKAAVRTIAGQVFEEWHKGVMQTVVRASERALFITLLDGLEQSFYEFQEHTGTGMADNRQRPLLTQGHIAGLTADERSAEYQAGTRWYGVRR
jgi:uncharacterized protein YukE